jgi:CRP-like cAMP-binding protein
MISPELLRRYPFFSFMDDHQLKEIAMHTEQMQCEIGKDLFEEGDPADALYFLLEGAVDLYYTVEKNFHSELARDFSVGEINPGEPFGISALIEPNILTSTARVAQPCRVLRIEGSTLKRLMEEDKNFAYILMSKIAKAAIERLHDTRIQLAAAWA